MDTFLTRHWIAKIDRNGMFLGGISDLNVKKGGAPVLYLKSWFTTHISQGYIIIIIIIVIIIYIDIDR